MAKGGSGVCLSDGLVMRQCPDEDVSCSSQRVCWVKSSFCCRVTLFALDNPSDRGRKKTLALQVMMVIKIDSNANSRPERFRRVCSLSIPPHFYRVKLTFFPPPSSAFSTSTGSMATRHTANVTRPKLAVHISSRNNDIQLECLSDKERMENREHLADI